ncbi:unnamed protein product, partial [Symbiodinium necroappetens]
MAVQLAWRGPVSTAASPYLQRRSSLGQLASRPGPVARTGPPSAVELHRRCTFCGTSRPCGEHRVPRGSCRCSCHFWMASGSHCPDPCETGVAGFREASALGLRAAGDALRPLGHGVLPLQGDGNYALGVHRRTGASQLQTPPAMPGHRRTAFGRCLTASLCRLGLPPLRDDA